MTILDEIIQHKQKEVEERKSLYPTKLLEQSIYFKTPPASLKEYLSRTDKSGVIAEIKRKSPSKGVINKNFTVEKVSIGYMQAGASALSILTDQKFFGGSGKDLSMARKFNYCPILRKDFIIDEYQVIEAKSIGADAILLIASVLNEDELLTLSRLARNLGLEVLLEVHNEEEIPTRIDDITEIVGVNNRDLSSFKVDIETSISLSEVLPDALTKVSESGISSPEAILKLRKYGYTGFLIGEAFMSSIQPEKECRVFIEHLKKMENELENKSVRAE